MTDESAIWRIFEAMDKMAERPYNAPYGLYDYSGYPGDLPPHVVRDERSWLPERERIVFRSWNAEAARSVFEARTKLWKARVLMSAYEGRPEPWRQ